MHRRVHFYTALLSRIQELGPLMLQALWCVLSALSPEFVAHLHDKRILLSYALPGPRDKRLTGNGEKLTYSCLAGCN